MARAHILSPLFTLGILGACGGPEPDSSDLTIPAEDILLGFVGHIDADGHATLTLTNDAAQLGLAQRGLVGRLRVARDGVPGSNPPNTLELRNGSPIFVNDPAACEGHPVSYCARVELQSFLPTTIRKLGVQITRLAPSVGRAALNSDPFDADFFAAFGPSPGNSLGFWRYDRAEHGNPSQLIPGQTAARTWVFDNTAAGDFYFAGVVAGELGETFLNERSLRCEPNGQHLASAAVDLACGGRCTTCMWAYVPGNTVSNSTHLFRQSSDAFSFRTGSSGRLLAIWDNEAGPAGVHDRNIFDAQPTDAWFLDCMFFDGSKANAGRVAMSRSMNGGPMTTLPRLQTVGTFPTVVDPTLAPIQVCAANGAESPAPEAFVSEAMIFDRVLSATERSSLIDAAGHPSDLTGMPGLLHWWRFGDGPGDTTDVVFDQVGSLDLVGQSFDGDELVSLSP
ncbi:MAG: hypothetical protein HY791_05185 [Deltaproteobacteria bacterium]|nr:hypothetical protein [Deltaproteobacteria bacterium]